MCWGKLFSLIFIFYSVKTDLMEIGANSTLFVAKVNKTDSGNYTCSIGEAQFYTVLVHVLNGKFTFFMFLHLLYFMLFICFSTLPLNKHWKISKMQMLFHKWCSVVKFVCLSFWSLIFHIIYFLFSTHNRINNSSLRV